MSSRLTSTPVTYSTSVGSCGCETTVNGKGEHIFEKVCPIHRYLRTCDRCFALVLPEWQQAHDAWHRESAR